MPQLAGDKHPYVPRRRSRADRAARRCPSRGGGRGSSCRLCTGSGPSPRSARSPCGTAGTSGRRRHRKTQRGTSSHTSWGGKQCPGFGASTGHLLPQAPPTVTSSTVSPGLGSNLSSFTLYSCDLQCLESPNSNTETGTLSSQL